LNFVATEFNGRTAPEIDKENKILKKRRNIPHDEIQHSDLVERDVGRVPVTGSGANFRGP
jgi:hypothetical protein